MASTPPIPSKITPPNHNSYISYIAITGWMLIPGGAEGFICFKNPK